MIVTMCLWGLILVMITAAYRVDIAGVRVSGFTCLAAIVILTCIVVILSMWMVYGET